MGGAIVSYLIVLIQFQITEEQTGRYLLASNSSALPGMRLATFAPPALF